MPQPIEDLWEAITTHTKLSTAVLTALWQNIQLRESEKVPDDWNSTYAILGDALCLPVLPHNIKRASLSIQNNGPGSAIVSSRFFDANEARALFNNATVGTIAQFTKVNSGQALTIGTRGAVYGCCLTTASTAELEMIETVFTSPTVPHAFADAHKPGLAGLVMDGLDPDAEHLHARQTSKMV